MLLDEDCDEILCMSSDQFTNHNLSMRKQAATETMIEEKSTSSDEKKKVAAINKVSKAPKQF